FEMRLALPPLKTMRALGYLRASSAVTTMRSGALRITGVSCATERSASIGPPSTTMPSGAPRAGSQGGKRCSSGYNRRFPSGRNPQIASISIDAIKSLRPSGAKRVASRMTPRMPMRTRMFVGSSMTPTVLDSTKNKVAPQNFCYRSYAVLVSIKSPAMPHHHLHSSPETCHWGFFEAKLKPVLTIESGDEVTIETISGGPDVVPDKTKFHIPPELFEVHAKSERMVPGHILTGPV